MDKNKVLKVEVTEMSQDEIYEFFDSYVNKARIAESLMDRPAWAFAADSKLVIEREVGQMLRDGCTVAQLNQYLESGK